MKSLLSYLSSVVQIGHIYKSHITGATYVVKHVDSTNVELLMLGSERTIQISIEELKYKKHFHLVSI